MDQKNTRVWLAVALALSLAGMSSSTAVADPGGGGAGKSAVDSQVVPLKHDPRPATKASGANRATDAAAEVHEPPCDATDAGETLELGAFVERDRASRGGSTGGPFGSTRVRHDRPGQAFELARDPMRWPTRPTRTSTAFRTPSTGSSRRCTVMADVR